MTRSKSRKPREPQEPRHHLMALGRAIGWEYVGMPVRNRDDGGNSPPSSKEAEDKRILEHVRAILVRLKSRLRERRRDDGRSRSGPLARFAARPYPEGSIGCCSLGGFYPGASRRHGRAPTGRKWRSFTLGAIANFRDAMAVQRELRTGPFVGPMGHAREVIR